MALLKIRSISWKIMIMFIMLTIIIISAFIFIIFENQMDLIKDNALLQGTEIATKLKIDIEKIIGKKQNIGKADLNNFSSVFQSYNIEFFDVMTEDGTKMGKSEAVSQVENYYLTKAIYKFNFENKFFYHRILKKSNEIEFYIPIAYGKNALLVLKPILRLNIAEKLKYLYMQCLIGALLIIVIFTLFVLLLHRLVINPIKILNTASTRISAGEFGYRVEIDRDDEIGTLAFTFNKMGKALEQMHREAKDANALTGLPGNAAIAREMDDRIKENQKFAVIYIDLDNFKAYNDKYGFTMGDEAIFYLCDKIKLTIEEVGVPGDDFSGHEGGDDFVLVVSPDRMEAIAGTLISHFDGDIKRFYNEEDVAQGFINSTSRDGTKQKFPFMSISCAIVTNLQRNFLHHAEVVKVASEMKKKVKAIDGSAYLVDRRKE